MNKIPLWTGIAIIEFVIAMVFLWQLQWGTIYLISAEHYRENMVREQFSAYLEGFGAGVGRCVVPNLDSEGTRL